jgi:hypothetical protein
VLAVDLRGRGETLGQRGDRRDSNYHLVSHSIAWGRPLAGRRAFDLTRALDYLATRADLSSRGVTAVGLGDDALPVLLAAAVDRRFSRIACAGFDLSFSTQMIPERGDSPADVLRLWNSSVMNNGRLNDGRSDADSGSVIPGVIKMMDLADLPDLLRDRSLLFAAARNIGSGSAEHRRAWQRNLAGSSRRWFVPDHPFTAELVLEWLKQP